MSFSTLSSPLNSKNADKEKGKKRDKIGVKKEDRWTHSPMGIPVDIFDEEKGKWEE